MDAVNTFRNKTLFFDAALNKARVCHGSRDKLHELQKFASPHVQWYRDLDYEGKQRLNEFMIQLDKTSRVDSKEEFTKNIYEDAYIIMEKIVKEVTELRPHFAGRLYKMGSAHNDMKIEQPDEIDFTYEISIQTLLTEKAKIAGLKSDKGRVLIYIEFEGDHPDISRFDFVGFPADPELVSMLSVNGSKAADYFKNALTRVDDYSYILNTEHIAYALFNVLDSVIANIELPANWSHGGYNFPHYSGLRLNIPAYLIQFAYKTPNQQAPLIVAFDFAPVLKLPENVRFTVGDVVDEYLDRHGYIQFPWQRLERGTVKGGYYSLAEENWLKSFGPESIPKIIVRVCKALHNMVRLKSPKYLLRRAVERIGNYRRCKAERKQNELELNDFFMQESYYSVDLGYIPGQTGYATLADVHENVGSHDYISSYIFKKILMTLMVLDENEGKEWTTEDIPEIVLSIYLTINDLIMSVNQATLIMSSSKQTDDPNTYVMYLQARSEVHIESEDSKSKGQDLTRYILEIPITPTKDKMISTIIYRRDPKFELKPYLEVHEAIKEGKCGEISQLFLREKFSSTERKVGLDEGIERVTTLLKYVSEGATAAFIHIRKPVHDDLDDQDIEEQLITKDKLKLILTESNV